MNRKLLVNSVIIVNILSVSFSQESSRDLSCSRGYKCVPINQCHANYSIVYPCDLENNRICCPPSIDNRKTVRAPSRMFPEDCGIVPVTDRITAGEEAAVGQFPWMALLGYTQRDIDLLQFLCGGTVITTQHVLTAAHCVDIPILTLSTIRLGETNLQTAIDCDGDHGKTKGRCAEPHVDVAVDKVTSHANYNKVSLENDIAIIKLKVAVNFTSYIRPICLPFQSFTEAPRVDTEVWVAGWGKTHSEQVGGSTKLLYAHVNIWDAVSCNNSLPSAAVPLKKSQICTNSENREDACKGDSGGPLSYVVLKDSDLVNVQIGIISFSSEYCGRENKPTVYTKVEHFLDWIQNKVN